MLSDNSRLFALYRKSAFISWDWSYTGEMPDKPIWFNRLDEAIAQLEALPHPWVDRRTVESVLEVGPRRAQQILQPIRAREVGRNGLTDRDVLVKHLRKLAAGESAYFEKQRRRQFAEKLGQMKEALDRNPRVLVEAPTLIVNQELDNLPAGVHLTPGRIVIDGFQTPEEAMQKLLALAMAMGKDPLGFEARILVKP